MDSNPSLSVPRERLVRSRPQPQDSSHLRTLAAAALGAQAFFIHAQAALEQLGAALITRASSARARARTRLVRAAAWSTRQILNGCERVLTHASKPIAQPRSVHVVTTGRARTCARSAWTRAGSKLPRAVQQSILEARRARRSRRIWLRNQQLAQFFHAPGVPLLPAQDLARVGFTLEQALWLQRACTRTAQSLSADEYLRMSVLAWTAMARLSLLEVSSSTAGADGRLRDLPPQDLG